MLTANSKHELFILALTEISLGSLSGLDANYCVAVSLTYLKNNYKTQQLL